MMPFPEAPETKILKRMVTMASAASLHTVFGLPGPFTVRHERHRSTQKTERPAISFRLVDIGLNEALQEIHTQDEVCWKMVVDIVVDLVLAPEADNSGGDDPTGWNALLATANSVANLFLVDGNDLLGLIDDTLPGDVDPDEDSTPDDGRLVRSIVVLYRTLRSDLNHLLNSEENAP